MRHPFVPMGAGATNARRLRESSGGPFRIGPHCGVGHIAERAGRPLSRGLDSGGQSARLLPGSSTWACRAAPRLSPDPLRGPGDLAFSKSRQDFARRSRRCRSRRRSSSSIRPRPGGAKDSSPASGSRSTSTSGRATPRPPGPCATLSTRAPARATPFARAAWTQSSQGASTACPALGTSRNM